MKHNRHFMEFHLRVPVIDSQAERLPADTMRKTRELTFMRRRGNDEEGLVTAFFDRLPGCGTVVNCGMGRGPSGAKSTGSPVDWAFFFAAVGIRVINTLPVVVLIDFFGVFAGSVRYD